MADETPNKRDKLRTAILSGRHAKKLIVEAFGIELEIRQPSLGELLDLQDIPDTKGRIIASLINYCYIPGTKEKVFDTTDTDTLLGLPYDENYITLQDAITKLTGVDMEEEKGNLENAPADITS